MAASLAGVAGFVDAIAYLHQHAFVANMTGTTVLLGIAIMQHAAGPAVRTAGAITLFVLGAVAARWILRDTARHGLALTSAACLIAVAAISPEPVRLFLLAAAMGMQDAAITRFDGVSINTVFISGDLIKLVQALIDRTSHAPGAVLRIAGVWVCYAGGAALGAWPGDPLVGPIGPVTVDFSFAIAAGVLLLLSALA